MKMKDIRERVLVLAKRAETISAQAHDISTEMVALEQLLYRKKGKHPRAPRTALTITPAMAKGIRKMKADNPEMANRDIGLLYGVDGGRVSEVLNGRRE